MRNRHLPLLVPAMGLAALGAAPVPIVVAADYMSIDDAQRAEVIEILKAGAMATGFATELWTLPRIGKVVKERFGVELSQSSVWRMLQQLGWSVQRPSGRARERNEKAIRTWKARRWPELKK